MNAMIQQPMTDNLCDERLAFAELARDLAQKKLVEHIEEHDRYPFSGLFTEAIRDAGVVGFYGINLSSSNCGVDMNTAMVAVIVEQLARYDASLSAVVFTNAAALEIVNQAAEDSACDALLQGIASLAATPLAFPSFSSPDEIDMPLVNGAAEISGRVSFLALGNVADYAVIPARDEVSGDFSWYLVNLADESIAKSKPLVTLGLHACPVIDISLKETKGELIGSQGMGRKYFDAMEQSMSVAAAAMSLGIMRGSLKSALEYTADRHQGGRQIIDWPQVRMMLANMGIETKIGEACLARACQEMDNDCPGWGLTARAAAIHIGEMATRSATDGVQLFGGNGYMKDYPQEKRMRDARQAQCILGMVPLKKINYIARHIEETRA
jgi:alkylation response protein AidB-like acyl-CoA dehydrogenase